MSGPSDYQPTHPALKWIERRLPIMGLVHSSFVAYPTPRNLNYWWAFGAILALMLGLQILTGVILAMHYTPEATMAFKSVESIVRDVNYGWLLRNSHAAGASMFFFAVYIHMFRGLYYGSYKEPREVLWILGVIIYLLMMATGFMGYVLPWGQMSFWGATVITNLCSAIPFVGESIVTLLWGGYSVGNPTLNRFFSLHYLLPFLIAGVVVLHVWALHVAGQNNPDGVEPKTEKDTVPFTPHATIKDGFGVACFLLLYAWFIFYMPNYLGDADNYIPANPGVTPRPVPNSIAEAVLAKTGSKSTPMVSTVIALALAGSLLAGSSDSARAEEGGTRPPGNSWSFAGPFGKYDRGALQRGLKVYKEVCSACHGLSYVSFRNLAEAGGPGYSVAQSKSFAEEYKIKDGPNDQGEMFERPGRPADYFPS